MKFIVDKLNSIITYLKSFFTKPHQQLPMNTQHQVILVKPAYNPMDDLPECNFKAEREGYAFRI
jgi:hypothetical protein